MKTEYQKMLAAELYDAGDEELKQMRLRARSLMHEYNHNVYDKVARRGLLQQLLGKIGANTDIQPPFFCDYGSHIEAGDNFFANFNCVFLDCNYIIIGHNVFLGPAVQVYAAHHPVIASERIKGPELAKPVTIGDNVWIGGGAIICPGVTIGSNTTLGAGSVVVKDIPENVVAAGNPCRVLREIEK
jgi:maltose O-acetyltransferase